MKKRVCIIFGGKSEEYEVSLSSAYGILESIDRDRYEISTIGITKNGEFLHYVGNNEDILHNRWQNNAKPIKIDFSRGCVDNFDKIDVFFPVCHGTFCEDGRLQGLFELMGARYVGCDSFSSFLCMDKHLTKLVADSIGVPTVKSICISNKSDLPKKISYPVFVKPALSGSSRGADKARNRYELESAIDKALLYSHKVLIEDYIEMLECEIGALDMINGDTVFSQVGSLSHSGEFYDYETKYINGGTHYSIPAKLPSSVSAKITEYARALFSTLGCKGLARLDFFVTNDYKIYFNEINTMPGFTKISMYPMLFKEMGYSFKELISIIIENALTKI